MRERTPVGSVPPPYDDVESMGFITCAYFQASLTECLMNREAGFWTAHSST
jgi:hypothetical protein